MTSETNPVIPRRFLWNIYIPFHDNNGVYFTIEEIMDWVTKAMDDCQGVTIYSGIKGLYKSDGQVMIDNNLGVLVNTTHDDVLALAESAKTKFNQECIMYYKVSDEVHFI